MYVDSLFTSNVGIGSSGHDFVGALFINCIISDTVAGWKAAKVGTSRVTMSGVVADAVEARMLATLLHKNEAKWSLDNFAVDCCCGGCSNFNRPPQSSLIAFTGVNNCLPEGRELRLIQSTLCIELFAPGLQSIGSA